MKQESYTCHKCHTHHSTDNMVAYCAGCYTTSEARVKHLEMKLSHSVTPCQQINAEQKNYTAYLDMKSRAEAAESELSQVKRELAEAHSDIRSLCSGELGKEEAMEGLQMREARRGS